MLELDLMFLKCQTNPLSLNYIPRPLIFVIEVLTHILITFSICSYIYNHLYNTYVFMNIYICIYNTYVYAYMYAYKCV